MSHTEANGITLLVMAAIFAIVAWRCWVFARHADDGALREGLTGAAVFAGLLAVTLLGLGLPNVLAP